MKKTRMAIKTTPLAFINWMLTQFKDSDWQAVSILPGRAEVPTPATRAVMKEKEKLYDAFCGNLGKVMGEQQAEVEAIDNNIMDLEQQATNGIMGIHNFIAQKKQEKEKLIQNHGEKNSLLQKEYNDVMDSFPVDSYVSVVTFDVILKHKTLDIEKSFQYRHGEHHSLRDLLNSVKFDGIATALNKEGHFYIRHEDKIYGFSLMSAEWFPDRSFNIAIATSTHYLCMDFKGMDRFLDLSHPKGLCNYKELMTYLLDSFEKEAPPIPEDYDCSFMRWVSVYDSEEYQSTEFESLPETLYGEFHVSWEEFLKTCSVNPASSGQALFALPPSTSSDEYNENEALVEEFSDTEDNINDNSFGR